MKVRGEITAFLSLVFVLLVAFIAAMIQSANVHTSRNEKRLEVDRAIYSLFGEYQKQLLEKYHIFALDVSYETGTYDEENLIHRLRYYGAMGMAHEIEALYLLSDNSGQAFREQVLLYMEERYGIGLVKDFSGFTKEWNEQVVIGEQIYDKEKGVQDELSETLLEHEEFLPEEDNPLSHTSELKGKSLLSLILPKEQSVSQKAIAGERQASVRTLRKGYGVLPMTPARDGVMDKLLFQEYILKQFSHAVSHHSKEMGELGNEGKMSEKRNLSYEIEYILEGKSSDKGNLEAVAAKLLGIRMGLNYFHLLGNHTLRAQAKALAATMATLLTAPGIMILIEQALLVAWAFGESIMDLRSLLAGKRVAIVKSTANWQLSLSSLLTLGTDEDIGDGSDTRGGMSYEDYLRMMLFVKSSNTTTMRTLDRVEQNMIHEEEKTYFRVDHCIMGVQIHNQAMSGNGWTYDFPVYFGYQ